MDKDDFKLIQSMCTSVELYRLGKITIEKLVEDHRKIEAYFKAKIDLVKATERMENFLEGIDTSSLPEPEIQQQDAQEQEPEKPVVEEPPKKKRGRPKMTPEQKAEAKAKREAKKKQMLEESEPTEAVEKTENGIHTKVSKTAKNGVKEIDVEVVEQRTVSVERERVDIEKVVHLLPNQDAKKLARIAYADHSEGNFARMRIADLRAQDKYGQFSRTVLARVVFGHLVPMFTEDPETACLPADSSGDLLGPLQSVKRVGVTLHTVCVIVPACRGMTVNPSWQFGSQMFQSLMRAIQAPQREITPFWLKLDKSENYGGNDGKYSLPNLLTQIKTYLGDDWRSIPDIKEAYGTVNAYIHCTHENGARHYRTGSPNEEGVAPEYTKDAKFLGSEVVNQGTSL